MLQGDLIEALMDSVGSELSKPARDLSEFSLNGNLDAAMRASSAQHDAQDQINRLRIKLDISQQNDSGIFPPKSIQSASLGRWLLLSEMSLAKAIVKVPGIRLCEGMETTLVATCIERGFTFKAISLPNVFVLARHSALLTIYLKYNP